MNARLAHKPAPSGLIHFSGLLLGIALVSVPSSATAQGPGFTPDPGDAPPGRWLFPVPGPLTLSRGFEPPEHDYGPGHRGIDLGPYPEGSTLVSPASGTIHFSGTVVDRGVLTIRVDDRTLLSLEPLSEGAETPETGDVVDRGQPLGEHSGASHCAPALCVHVGVRVDGHYVNPLPYFLGRPMLLPLSG